MIGASRALWVLAFGGVVPYEASLPLFLGVLDAALTVPAYIVLIVGGLIVGLRLFSHTVTFITSLSLLPAAIVLPEPALVLAGGFIIWNVTCSVVGSVPPKHPPGKLLYLAGTPIRRFVELSGLPQPGDHDYWGDGAFLYVSLVVPFVGAWVYLEATGHHPLDWYLSIEGAAYSAAVLVGLKVVGDPVKCRFSLLGHGIVPGLSGNDYEYAHRRDLVAAEMTAVDPIDAPVLRRFPHGGNERVRQLFRRPNAVLENLLDVQKLDMDNYGVSEPEFKYSRDACLPPDAPGELADPPAGYTLVSPATPSTSSANGTDAGDKEYTCPECGDSFDSEHGRRTHYGQKHGDTDSDSESAAKISSDQSGTATSPGASTVSINSENYTYRWQAPPSTTFADIGGYDDVKERLAEEVIQPLNADSEGYERFNVEPDRGILFYGPPGTGKTLFAKALARGLEKPFVKLDQSRLSDWRVDSMPEKIGRLFDEAEELGGVIFIDEIDQLVAQREGTGTSNKQEKVTNTFLTRLSEENPNYVFIGTTNRADMIDDAMLRPGRLSQQIEIGMPGPEARRAILETKLAKVPDDLSAEDYQRLVDYTEGGSGADIEDLVKSARQKAADENAEAIKLRHFPV
jgi:AAA+ superfamily predicted ATPase